MPKRPPWKYSMSKEQVERTEQEMFENFLDKIYDEYKLSELSYFERNLEVNATCNVIYSIQNEIFEADSLDRKEIFNIIFYSLNSKQNMTDNFSELI